LHRQQFEKSKQNVDVAPPGKFLRTPMQLRPGLIGFIVDAFVNDEKR